MTVPSLDKLRERSDDRLAGRVALVTGGAGGIGQWIALGLAAAGAAVAVTSRDIDRLSGTLEGIAELGGEAEPIGLDIREADSVDAAVEQTLARFGKLDILVANSGIGGPTSPLWEVEPEDWDETFDINVRGTYLTVRAAVRQMIDAQAGGSIVVIGSMTGKRPLLNRTPYAASKLALVGMVRTLATELGPHGIRANVVSPGFVLGDRLDWLLAAQAQAQQRPEDDVRADAADQAPLRRFVNPADIAHAVVHLASDDAAAVTGIDHNVTAGLVMY